MFKEHGYTTQQMMKVINKQVTKRILQMHQNKQEYTPCTDYMPYRV